MISIYGTFIGLIINMIIFYGFNFSPPMAIIPLFISIISLLVYSIYKKQFFDFVDLESKESKELKEMVKIQEIQDIPSQIDFLKGNISFNGEKLFEEDKNFDELKYKDNKDEINFDKDSDSDEEDKKKHENIINNLSDKFNYNKISNEPQEDSDIEGVEKLINLVGGESKENLQTPAFPKKRSKKMTLDLGNNNDLNINIKKHSQKMVEMKFLDEKNN